MKSFSKIRERAIKRKGGEENLYSYMPTEIVSQEKLAKLSNDRFLSAMTKSIFQAGFNWEVIENKWSGFEGAFWKFNVRRCAAIGPEDFDSLCGDTRIVRNPQKINSVSINAAMILEWERDGEPFAKQVAYWPDDDFIGLLDYLHKRGSRLGGMTAQYFLRHLGKDGFLIGKDGVAALVDAGVVAKKPTSRADFKAVQHAFNCWREESGYNNAQISRILALSIDSPTY